MSAQSLIGYVVLVVLGAIMWGIAGFVVDGVIIPWGNTFVSGFMAMGDSYDTAHFLIQIIVASPFIGILLWGYDHLNNSNQQSGGDS